MFISGCEDCTDFATRECPHGPLTSVRDRHIPSRAKLTTPHFLSVKTIELRAGEDNGEKDIDTPLTMYSCFIIYHGKRQVFEQ